MGNSAAAAGRPPPPPPSKSKQQRYVTWERNGGALNNQLISVAAAFDTAKAMGRTIYIEADATAMEDNDPNPSLRWPKVCAASSAASVALLACHRHAFCASFL